MNPSHSVQESQPHALYPFIFSSHLYSHCSCHKTCNNSLGLAACVGKSLHIICGFCTCTHCFPVWLLLQKTLQDGSRLFTVLWGLFVAWCLHTVQEKEFVILDLEDLSPFLMLVRLRSAISVSDDCWEKDFAAGPELA